MLLLSFVLCVVFVGVTMARRHNSDDKPPAPDASLKHCAYKREEAIECAQRFGDREHNADGTRGNGLICAAEIQQLEQQVLGWGSWLLDFLYPAERIIARCDYDGDGQISLRDFEMSSETCLHDCDKLTLFFSKVCKPAEEMDLDLPEVACE